MSSKTPIVGIGPVDGDAANILNKTNAGIMVDYKDKSGLKSAIRSILNGEFTTANSTIAAFSREALTADLVAAIEDL